MEQRDNMHNGKLYDPNDDSVMEEQMVCLDRLYDFNQTRPSEMDKRNAIMKEMMGDVGKDCYIEPPFHANWGGKHVHFGDGVYANFGLTCVDDTHIYVGSHTLFGPTPEQLQEVETAKKYPIEFDEDCEELSPAMVKAFKASVVHRNRKKNA